jgi:hypothetical protein
MIAYYIFTNLFFDLKKKKKKKWFANREKSLKINPFIAIYRYCYLSLFCKYIFKVKYYKLQIYIDHVIALHLSRDYAYMDHVF